MIDKDSLLATGVYPNPYQKEKDYIEELFLTEIYGEVDELVFKGGTAISKFYGSARFSDDLDFSLLSGHGNPKGVSARINKIIMQISKDYPTKVLRAKNIPRQMGYELSLRGPLFEVFGKYQHLKIEIDKRASVLEQAKAFRRNPAYPDLKPYVAVVMGEREILAEKVVALLFRHNPKARDLYDIYYLINNGVELRVSLMDKKMKEYGHTFTADKFLKRMDLISRIWEKELRRLLPEGKFIGYATAEKLVKERFKQIL